jgi:hypothetical protein
MSATPGTIAGYDVVLSISEASINKGLQQLYNHELEHDFVPVRTPVKGAAPAALSKYAINHDMIIQVADGTNDNGEASIDPDIGTIISFSSFYGFFF